MPAVPSRPRTRARLAAVAATAVALALAPGAAHAAPVERLPDFEQEVPYQLQVTSADTLAGTEYRLGFASGVKNLGSGPLIIHGVRQPGAAEMDAFQRVMLSDGSSVDYPGAGKLHYVSDPTHSHWHLEPFLWSAPTSA